MNDITALVTPALVYPLFPGALHTNIDKYLPPILAAMHDQGLGDLGMLCIAFGTIRAETAGFVPISEGQSHYNTLRHPFDLYDFRHDLGNGRIGDGALYKGRGFIQLTGKANYREFNVFHGTDLINNPHMANDPAIAAKLLALFIKAKEPQFGSILAADTGDEWQDITMLRLRRLVNGGSHGIEAFTDCFVAAWNTLPEAV